MKSPAEIVAIMMEKDAYSQWLGIEVLEIGPGTCSLSCQVQSNMLNGFAIAHGGISYSLADSALAFSSNSHGLQCVSIETSISHVRPTFEQDILRAVAVEKSRGKTTGIYEVTVTNQHNKPVAFFKGTVHISDKIW